MPTALGEVTTVVLNDHLYVVGEGSAHTYAMHLGNWTWKSVAERPFPGHHSAGVVYNGEWYLFGGLCCNAGSRSQIYNPVTDVWREGPMLPEVTGSANAVVLKGFIVLCGGIGDTGTIDKCYR
eukprot:TRINITY_DN10666_c0_g1_i1.p3 TRINITY_DN10666_c0_g1~~TRINITY_DN10666_c0_g1_i1.p3  ORF type:complete len:123 (-),score=12.04 TRINITY_DN10666_c0_g1_i1:1819-2187(-)